MRMRLIAIGIILGLVGGIAAGAAASSHDISKQRTVVLSITLTKQGERDIAPKGLSAGDILVDRFSANRNGTRAGYGNEDCRVTFPASKSSFVVQCQEFLSLKSGGRITASGEVPVNFAKGGPQPTVFAITGGTGNYENVRGQITTKPVGRHEVWTLHLVP